MEIRNLPDAEFTTLVIRLLKELSEDHNSIKQSQSETNDTLIEIKNNLQGNNSRMNEAKNQNKQTNKQSEEEEKGIKKMKIV